MVDNAAGVSAGVGIVKPQCLRGHKSIGVNLCISTFQPIRAGVAEPGGVFRRTRRGRRGCGNWRWGWSRRGSRRCGGARSRRWGRRWPGPRRGGRARRRSRGCGWLRRRGGCRRWSRRRSRRRRWRRRRRGGFRGWRRRRGGRRFGRRRRRSAPGYDERNEQTDDGKSLPSHRTLLSGTEKVLATDLLSDASRQEGGGPSSRLR